MKMYVSVGDSISNTDNVSLVLANSKMEASITVPVMPNTKAQVEDFAYIMGWHVTYDANGSPVLHTFAR